MDCINFSQPSPQGAAITGMVDDHREIVPMDTAGGFHISTHNGYGLPRPIYTRPAQVQPRTNPRELGMKSYPFNFLI